MTKGCGRCGLWGFALSAIVHVSVAALVISRAADGAVGEGVELPVPVTLAMFAAPSAPGAEGPSSDLPPGEPPPDPVEQATRSEEPPTDDGASIPPDEEDAPDGATEPVEPELTESPAAEPVAESAEPAPESEEAPTETPPDSATTAKDQAPQRPSEPIAKASPAPVEQEPAPVIKPSPPPRPRVAAEPKPAPKPRQKPTRTPPPEPAPRPISRPKPRPEPKIAAPVKTSPSAEARSGSGSSRPSRQRTTASPSAPTPKPSSGYKGRSGTAQPGASSKAPGAGISSSGKSSGDTKALSSRYLGELRRAIAKNRRYPPQARRRGETGTVSVAFVVQRNGSISGVRVAGSSGSAALDKAATDAVKRLGRFKPIPKALARSSWSMRVPIQFQLR